MCENKYITKQYSVVHHPSHIDLIGMGQNIATRVLLRSYYATQFLFRFLFFLSREAVNTIRELRLNGKMLKGTFWWSRLILHILCAAANSSCHKFWTSPQYYIWVINGVPTTASKPLQPFTQTHRRTASSWKNGSRNICWVSLLREAVGILHLNVCSRVREREPWRFVYVEAGPPGY